jgi:hypothetical protein
MNPGLTAEERQSVSARVRAYATAPKPATVLAGFRDDAKGRLWVITPRVRADSTELDVFDRAGRYLGTRRVAGRAQALTFAGSELLVLVEHLAGPLAGAQGVRRYLLVESGQTRRPRIEFTQASLTPAPGFAYRRFAYGPVDGRQGMYFRLEPAASDLDFEHADGEVGPGELSMALTFTPAGWARLDRGMYDNVGKYFAVLIDSLPVHAAMVAPRSRAEPTDSLGVRTLFIGLRVPDSTANRLASWIAARWPPSKRH